MSSSSASLFNPGTKRKRHGGTCQDNTDDIKRSKHLKTAARHGHDDSVFLNQQHHEQRRMVLMETGVPVHGLRTYADVWTALEGGVEGLYTLHQQGFVHRDINSGNILLIGAGLEKRGVIVDLEHAKGIHDKPAPHDLKTGTATFMSVEVERSVYTHTPEIFSTSGKTVKHKKPRFRQNALHDHESVWWVALWMQFYLVRPGDTLLPDHHRNFDAVFDRAGGRSHFWLGFGAYLAFTTQFPDESNFQEVMSVWKNSLKGCYTASYTAENYVVIDVDIIDEAHEAQKEALRLLREGTQDYPLELSCLADLDPVVSEPEVPPSTTAESSELTKGSLDSGSPLST